MIDWEATEPGARGPSAWATLGIRTLKDSFDDRIPKLAAEVAFFALLAMPSALLAVLGSLAFVAGALGPEITSAVEEQILAVARTFLTPSTVQEVVEPAVSTLLEEGRADVVSVGILLALWSASRATSAVHRHHAHRVRPGDVPPGDGSVAWWPWA